MEACQGNLERAALSDQQAAQSETIETGRSEASSTKTEDSHADLNVMTSEEEPPTNVNQFYRLKAAHYKGIASILEANGQAGSVGHHKASLRAAAFAQLLELPTSNVGRTRHEPAVPGSDCSSAAAEDAEAVPATSEYGQIPIILEEDTKAATQEVELAVSVAMALNIWASGTRPVIKPDLQAAETLLRLATTQTEDTLRMMGWQDCGKPGTLRKRWTWCSQSARELESQSQAEPDDVRTPSQKDTNFFCTPE